MKQHRNNQDPDTRKTIEKANKTDTGDSAMKNSSEQERTQEMIDQENGTAKSSAPKIHTENIPEELKTCKQWVCWKYEPNPKKKKPDKPPYDPKKQRVNPPIPGSIRKGGVLMSDIFIIN